MESRMNKYNNQNLSRVAKNEELYKKINESSLDNFSVRSNATVIGNQDPEIDIEKIKKILDTKYNNAPKRRSIRIDLPEEEEKIDEVKTKEYDLNIILEKAKDEKEETYEEARAKKLRNTQFDILNKLNLEDESKEEKTEPTKAEEDLIELINTISINEKKINEISEKLTEEENKEDNPLDLLTELKGSENTEVYEGMTSEITKKLNEERTEEKEENKENVIKEETIDDSFYTNSLFNKADFKDEDDEKDLSVAIKILIALVIICFLVGLFLFIKSFIIE